MKYYLLIFVFLFSYQSSLGYKVNITTFENCPDVYDGVSEIPVGLTSVTYDRVDGLCDTVHGTYRVKTVDTSDKELLITVYQCSTGSTGQCNDNPENHIERLHCEKFKGDDSGPWYMVSSGMSGSHCGETTGDFTLDNSTLRPEYLKNYIKIDKDNLRYRMRMLFHRKGEVPEDIHVRGCLSIEFNIIP